jgi:mannosyltransferase
MLFNRNNTSSNILLFVIILAGGFLRFYGLGRDSFWYNEAASYFYSKGNVVDVIRYSFTIETNPPGFHLLIHFWKSLVGISEWALRVPCAVAGTLSIWVVYLFAGSFLNRKGALVVAALLAVSPLHVWYSQECRAFAFWVLFIFASYGAFLRWMECGSNRWLTLSVICGFLAVSFHYFGLHAIIVENAFFLIKRRTLSRAHLRAWWIAQICLALALLPFAAMMLAVDRTNVSWWRESGVQLQTLKSLAFHLNGVFFFIANDRWPKCVLLLTNGIALLLGCQALAQRGKLLFPLLAVLLPVIMNLTWSVAISPILGNPQSAGRYFLLTLPPYIILLAAGWQFLFERIRLPGICTLAFACVLALNVWGIRASWANVEFRRDDNRRLAQVLFANAHPGDLVIAYPHITLDYYAARLGYDMQSLRLVPTSRFDTTLDARLPEHIERVWFFFDPVHHFEPLVKDIAKRKNVTRIIEKREHGLSGVGLFLMAKPDIPKAEDKIQ